MRTRSLDDLAASKETLPTGWVEHNDCLIVPSSNGLHDSRGQPIPESHFQRGPSHMVRFPYGGPKQCGQGIDAAALRMDTVVFMPMIRFDHFGHMLTETASWMSELLDPDSDLMPNAGEEAVFVFGAKSGFEDDTVEGVRRLFDLPSHRAMSIDSIESPTSCRRALLPRPTMVDRRAIDTGHFAAVRRFVDRWYGLNHGSVMERLESLEPSAGTRNEKLYLSRSKLPTDIRNIIGEDALEHELERLGWRIVHPETLSITEQMEALFSARVLAGNTGSAFHLMMYFGTRCKGKTVIGLGMRSETVYYSHLQNFVIQFRMQGIDFRHLSCLTADPASSSVKSNPNYRFQDLRPAFPIGKIAKRMEELAGRAAGPTSKSR